MKGLVSAPKVPVGSRSAWARYEILCEERDQLYAALKAVGIPTNVYCPKPLHLQTVFSFLHGTEGDCPVAESLSTKVLSLPMYPYLDETQSRNIINATRVGRHSRCGYNSIIRLICPFCDPISMNLY